MILFSKSSPAENARACSETQLPSRDLDDLQRPPRYPRSSSGEQNFLSIAPENRVSTKEVRAKFIVEDNVRMADVNLIGPECESVGCIRQPDS